jgi:aminopeptidase N
MTFVIKNKSIFYSLVIAFSCFTFQGQSQFEKDKARSRILQIDQLSLHANLGFEPEQGVIGGQVTIEFKNISNHLDSIWLDAIKMKVDQAHLNGVEVPFRIHEKGIALLPESELVKDSIYTLVLSYEASPKRGMYFLGWNDSTQTERRQIWTQGQGIDNRHWLPHVDAQNDKLVCSLSLTFNNGYEVISNGNLSSKAEGDNETTWHYKMLEPMSSYLLMIAIGEYDMLSETSASNVSLSNYYYPEWKDRNEWTYYKSIELFNWMEKEVGVSYPWQNYKQVPVKDFQHGAMENTTATIFGDFYCVDEIGFNDDNYVGVNAHELAHQWFGNDVTALSSHDHWLHEGFATYYSWLAEREIFGEERFEELLMSAETHIVQDNMTNDYPLHHSKAGSVKFYEGGAWFLHMLKAQIGEEVFKASIKQYLNEYNYNTVTTRNFKQTCEKVSGKDLTQFFKQWLERPFMPVVNVTAEYEPKESKFTMRLEQTQEVTSRLPEYSFKVPFVIYTNMDTYTYETTLGNVSKSLKLTLNPKEEIKYIEVDPNAEILAEWIYYLPNEWVSNQLKEGTSQMFASRVLSSADKDDYSEKNFEDINMKDWPDYLQAAYVGFIINNENISEKYIASQLEESSLQAKLAYLSIKSIPKSHEKMVRSWLKEPSYTLREETLLKLFISYRENGDDYLKMTKGVDGTRGNNVKVMWEFVSYINSKGSGSTQELINLTSSKYDFLTRMKSLEALSALNLEQVPNALLANCFQGVFQGNRRWRGSAIIFLRKSNEDPNMQKAIFAYIDSHKNEWQSWQKKRVENVFSIEIED